MAEASALLIPLITGAASAAASSALTKTPKVKDPVSAPAPDDASAVEARRRKQAELAAIKGREATNLTPSTGAAPSYSNTVLGGS